MNQSWASNLAQIDEMHSIAVPDAAFRFTLAGVRQENRSGSDHGLPA